MSGKSDIAIYYSSRFRQFRMEYNGRKYYFAKPHHLVQKLEKIKRTPGLSIYLHPEAKRTLGTYVEEVLR